jgi:uncharacterized protein YodC (DUF2158 family)
MASTFKKGDVVKVPAVSPQGPVQSIRMLEDGEVQYLIEWQDADGQPQQRWFNETQLTAA